MTKAMKSLVGRKGVVCGIAAALVTLVLGFAIWKTNKFTDGMLATYCDFIKWDVGFFVIGNIGEHFADKKPAPVSEMTSPSV